MPEPSPPDTARTAALRSLPWSLAATACLTIVLCTTAPRPDVGTLVVLVVGIVAVWAIVCGVVAVRLERIENGPHTRSAALRRGALGGLRWSSLAALVFGTNLYLQGREGLGSVVVMEGMLMLVWIGLAAFVGWMQGWPAPPRPDEPREDRLRECVRRSTLTGCGVGLLLGIFGIGLTWLMYPSRVTLVDVFVGLSIFSGIGTAIGAIAGAISGRLEQ